MIMNLEAFVSFSASVLCVRLSLKSLVPSAFLLLQNPIPALLQRLAPRLFNSISKITNTRKCSFILCSTNLLFIPGGLIESLISGPGVFLAEGGGQLLSSARVEDEKVLLGLGRVGIIDDQTSGESGPHRLCRNHLDLGAVFRVELKDSSAAATLQKKRFVRLWFIDGNLRRFC